MARNKSALQAFVEQRWYHRPGLLGLLAPLEALFIAASRRRRQKKQSVEFDVPVVVVGNISVGGTGKTPVVKALVAHLRALGRNPGVVSRGYGRATTGVLMVENASTARQVGDEPLEIRRSCDVPTVVGEDRVAAVEFLLARAACDVVISDDGLQHYRLGRQFEIAVVDGSKGLGNGHCLPVGPLREPPHRLAEVDAVLISGAKSAISFVPAAATVFTYAVKPAKLVNVRSGEVRPVDWVAGFEKFTAIAGIGNPEKFFSTLTDLLPPEYPAFARRQFADHHQFTEADFRDLDRDTALLMTEKDSVKCVKFARDNWWYLAVDAVLDTRFYTLLGRVLSQPISD
ncbi:tetraacyldisaccharide 4'-kinase [Teredinibacter turnerae]|uniref:tetraacyldisaccharide 4'-kinase n=1 Tax=Teredinibacter turnerae TaxID=2426 RepID=UPI000360AEFD|nr:tetraacyldisaccharide 4'-kinase [Teredinibacter turnerae]